MFPFSPSPSLVQTAATNPGHGTRFLTGLFFCLLHGFWDLISICSCPELCIGQLQIPCGVQSTDAMANGVVSPTGSTTRLAALALERIPDRKSTSHCVMTTLYLGRDDRGKENAVSPP